MKQHVWFQGFDFSLLEARNMKSPYKPPAKTPEQMIQNYVEEPEEVFDDVCKWDPDFDISKYVSPTYAKGGMLSP